jgi:predicted nucleotidyltransferase
MLYLMVLDETVRTAIADGLACFPDVRLALLFGSRSRGTHRPDSDTDIAISAPLDQLFAIGAALSQRLGGEVDVIRLEDASIPLVEALIAESIVVYERDAGAGALWRSRTLAQLGLDRPWYARQRDAWLARVATHGLT